MTFIEIFIKRWYVYSVILVLGVIILLLFLVGISSSFGKESFSTVHMYEFNESVIPQGNSISLTEDDFKEFPQLASIIRDKNQKSTHSYTILLTSDEYYKFIGRYWSNSSGENQRFFEYKGNYYGYDNPQIH